MTQHAEIAVAAGGGQSGKFCADPSPVPRRKCQHRIRPNSLTEASHDWTLYSQGSCADVLTFL